MCVYQKIFLSFVLLPLFIYGQFEKSDFNLSSEFVESILIDSRGAKWIGTDEGLNLITHSNTYPFYSNISNTKGILNSEVHKIKEVNNNFIAVFSNGGISFFNPKTFSFEQLKLKSKPIDIYFDSNTKKYWVTTASSGLYVLNADKEIEKNLIYDPLNPLTLSSSNFDPSNDNKLIDFEDDYYIYVATPNGFNVYNKSQKNIKRYFKQRSSSLLSNNINSVIRISEKELLIGTDKGINIFNTSSKKFSKTLIAEGKNVSHLFKINSDKYCFIAKGKLYYFNLNNKNFNLGASLKLMQADERLNVIKKEGQLYSYFKGDNRLISVDLDEQSKQTISINSNIQTLMLSNKQLYIGTSQGVYEQKNILKLVENKRLNGIYYYHNSNNNLMVYKNKILVNNKKIKMPFGIDINSQTIFEFSNGLLFMGGENLTVLDVNEAVFFKNIFSREDLLEGKLNNLKVINSNLYVSTGNGIVSYSIPESINNSFPDTLIKSQIKYKYNPLVNSDVPKSFSDIELIDGYLWVGDKDEGLKLYKLDFNSFVKDFSYQENNINTLATSAISKLFFDNLSNHLYVASRGDGLFKLNLKDTTFNNITVKNGLLSNNIFDFMQKDNTIWIQTGNGINSINEKGEVRNINSEDGINIKNFHKEALHDLGEEILISGFDNIQIFNPSNMDSFQKEKFDLDILNVVGYDKENQSRYLEIDEKNIITIDDNISSIEINLFTNSRIKSEQIKYYLSSNIYDDILFNGYSNKINLKSIPFYSSNFEMYACSKLILLFLRV
jgi:ligand-binding sensor domain-containing protein